MGVWVRGVQAEPECTRSGRAGQFALPTPAASAAVLFASAPGYLPLELRLEESAWQGRLRLELRGGGVLLQGHVLDALGGPIVGALLSASAAERTLTSFGVTGPDGDFSLSVSRGQGENTSPNRLSAKRTARTA
jgi:hypothetical protein